MNLSGPLAASPINSAQNSGLGLRLFQRVTAQVLAVTGTAALLTIEGYPVVAQLGSADQASELLTQQTAQFVVTQLTSQKITLKIDKKNEATGSWPGPGSHKPELAVRLLEQHNIPVTVRHLMVARSMLKKNLPVTLGTFEELLEALSGYDAWGNKESDLAAALKAAGLPVNADSLALASRRKEKIGDWVARLITMLTHAAGQDPPADLLERLDQSLKMLNALVLNGDAETSRLAEQLKAWVDMWGISAERILLEQSQTPGTSADENNLLSLFRLQQILEQAGKNEAATAMKEFLTDLRLNQFLNARPDPLHGQDHWLDISLAVQERGQKSDKEFSTARLRIARDPKNSSGKIDPACTRLILQVEMRAGETVEVDLSVAGKHIRASVTTADPLWCQQAQSELPDLAQALQHLGFSLKDTQIRLGKPQVFDLLQVLSNENPLMTVDIEV